jgi:hypothetical protein
MTLERLRPQTKRTRTTKQIESARALSLSTFPAKPIEAIVITGSQASLPASSWWAGKSREELAASVKQEQDRMARSSFGKSGRGAMWGGD